VQEAREQQRSRSGRMGQEGSIRNMSAPGFLTFVRAWVRAPLEVGAVLPSGKALSRLITREIGPDTGRVIELGPGTGVFTRALLARGVRGSDLTLVEANPDFARLLRLQFPEVSVVCTDARALARSGLNREPLAGAVVSGLPLLNMSTRCVMSILAGSFACLRHGGRFYQFTYGLTCPVRRPLLDRLGLDAVRLGRTFRNFPPAAVYVLSRRSPEPM
jgi:phosphatidylethanolamine/phosphatidyl-N-methylethanolamine N-methyltransferase